MKTDMLAWGSLVIEIGLHIWLWASWWTSEGNQNLLCDFFVQREEAWQLLMGTKRNSSHQLHGCSQSSVSLNVKWGYETQLSGLSG